MATQIVTTATPLATSVALHVVVYALLLLTPPWPYPPRTGLTAELVSPEETTPVSPPRLLRRTVERTAPPAPRPARPARSAVATAPPASPSREAKRPAEPSSAPAPSIVVAAADTDTVPTSSTGVGTSIREEPAVGPAASTTPSAFDEGSAARSSAAPTIAALPPGKPSRDAIPRGGYQVKPTYPSTARRLGIEGTVLLAVLVDSAGRVGEVVVRRSGGHPDLDRAAADAVKQWAFEPARRGTDAIAMWVEVPVQFRLR